MKFLEDVFGASIKECLRQGDGTVMHAEVKIGECIIMIGQGTAQFPSYTNSNYVFVENADTTFAKALAYGAESIMEPADRFYGHREGGFKDSSGNNWWIAHQIEQVSMEELQERLKEMK